MMEQAGDPKPVVWVGSSLRDLRSFPRRVREVFGFALFQAQMGGQHVSAKPMRGFGGAGVLEVIEDLAGSTYRAVYTVRFRGVVYVLHVFQKKSKTGIRTPLPDVALIHARLRRAQQHHQQWEPRHGPTRP